MGSAMYKLIIATLVCAAPITGFADARWDTFLNKPNKKNYLSSDLKISKDTPCSPGEELMSPEQYKKLYSLVKNRNEFALNAGIKFSKCMGAADSEDFDRSAGLYFEKNPASFLEVVSKSRVGDKQVKSMLVILPEETVDNFDQQIVILEKRLKLIKDVDEPSLKAIKAVGLKGIEEALKSTRDIKDQMRNK